MKVTHCDNHPDRGAVVTLVIRTFPPGSRFLLIGMETPRRYFDFCAECRDVISPLIKEETDA